MTADSLDHARNLVGVDVDPAVLYPSAPCPLAWQRAAVFAQVAVAEQLVELNHHFDEFRRLFIDREVDDLIGTVVGQMVDERRNHDRPD